MERAHLATIAGLEHELTDIKQRYAQEREARKRLEGEKVTLTLSLASRDTMIAYMKKSLEATSHVANDLSLVEDTLEIFGEWVSGAMRQWGEWARRHEECVINAVVSVVVVAPSASPQRDVVFVQWDAHLTRVHHFYEIQRRIYAEWEYEKGNVVVSAFVKGHVIPQRATRDAATTTMAVVPISPARILVYDTTDRESLWWDVIGTRSDVYARESLEFSRIILTLTSNGHVLTERTRGAAWARIMTSEMSHAVKIFTEFYDSLVCKIDSALVPHFFSLQEQHTLNTRASLRCIFDHLSEGKLVTLFHAFMERESVWGTMNSILATKYHNTYDHQLLLAINRSGHASVLEQWYDEKLQIAMTHFCDMPMAVSNMWISRNEILATHYFERECFLATFVSGMSVCAMNELQARRTAYELYLLDELYSARGNLLRAEEQKEELRVGMRELIEEVRLRESRGVYR